MSDSQAMLCETATRVFETAADKTFDDAWAMVAEAGFPLLLLSEEDGGFGGDWSDFVAVMKIAGASALNVPVGETMLANWLAKSCGLEAGDGAITLAVADNASVAAGAFTGVLRHAPWGGSCQQAMTIIDGSAVLVDVKAGEAVQGRNAAGEARDTLSFSKAKAALGACAVDLMQIGALMRAAQSAGALDRAMRISIDYANERKQFGRTLNKFQAVQQNIAVLAAEVAAADCAVQAAAAEIDGVGLEAAWLGSASAKQRTNVSIGHGVSISHQAHGAIGFTMEYPLQISTRRLLSWRSEFGNDRYWSERIGAYAAKLGGRGLWRAMTDNTDSLSRPAAS